jgi:hypothetical protein
MHGDFGKFTWCVHFVWHTINELQFAYIRSTCRGELFIKQFEIGILSNQLSLYSSVYIFTSLHCEQITIPGEILYSTCKAVYKSTRPISIIFYIFLVISNKLTAFIVRLSCFASVHNYIFDTKTKRKVTNKFGWRRSTIRARNRISESTEWNAALGTQTTFYCNTSLLYCQPNRLEMCVVSGLLKFTHAWVLHWCGESSHVGVYQQHTYVVCNCNKPEGLYYRMQKVYFIYIHVYIDCDERTICLFDDEKFINTLKGVYTSEFYLSTCSAKVWVFLLSISIVRFKLLFIREWIAQQAAWMSVFIFC